MGCKRALDYGESKSQSDEQMPSKRVRLENSINMTPEKKDNILENTKSVVNEDQESDASA